MQRVLVKMNFGPSFRSWVQLLYTGIFLRVLVNGYTSEAFKITRGVRQGCPLSPLLYIMVAETISRAVQKDPAIDGFDLPGGQHVKLFQYADVPVFLFVLIMPSCHCFLFSSGTRKLLVPN